jgi:hypothetical protein
MLRTEAVEISCWYDFEAVLSLTVFCGRCGAPLDDVLESCADVTCSECGETAKFSELDALADSLEAPVPHVDE